MDITGKNNLDDSVDDSKSDLLKTMKLRILKSFRWKADVVDPLSSELEIDSELFEEILMSKLDMSSIDALHSTFESAKPQCLAHRFHADLKLCWLVDVLELLPKEQTEILKMHLVKEVIDGSKYEDILEKGKKQIIEMLML
ncbi:MAG: DUF1959 family protein [Methanobacteriaceae archaeon]